MEVGLEGSSRIRRYLDRVAKNARDLDRMRISSALEAEILSALIQGRRTVSELTEQMFGVTRGDPNYHTYYMKVRRATKGLQRRGYVATRLFGRDKPYKLTPFAFEKMTDVKEGTPRVLPARDAFAFVATVAFGLANMALANSSPWLSTPLTLVVYTVFVFLAGYCLSRLAAVFRRVS